MKKIVIYGKDGIGKSTTVSSVSATIAVMGLTVMQIGCDPRADSTCNLAGGKNIPTVLNTLREKDDAVLGDIVVRSPSGILCMESGGPVPGVGHAGWGIVTAFEKLEELDACEIYRPDVMLCSVPGDVMYGGFAMPIRDGCAGEACIIASGEMVSLYATSNIVHTVKSFGKHGYTTLRGLILNAKNVEGEDELVDKAAEKIEAPVLYHLPRRPLVQQVKAQGKTVVKTPPSSDMAAHYRELARLLVQETAGSGCSCPM